MQAAVRANDLDQVIKLAQNDQSVATKDEDARTALHWSASSGSLEVLEWLLSQPGTLVNAQDDAGWTPLMIAVSAGHVEIVVTLLNHGADANISNENGQIPLHYHRGRVDIAELLLEYTKDVNTADVYGSTPLMRAVGNYPNSDVLRMLLQHGAALSDCDLQGNTALHLALLEDQQAIAMELIQAGADLTATNGANKSCLDLARATLKEVIRQKNT